MQPPALLDREEWIPAEWIPAEWVPAEWVPARLVGPWGQLVPLWPELQPAGRQA